MAAEALHLPLPWPRPTQTSPPQESQAAADEWDAEAEASELQGGPRPEGPRPEAVPEDPEPLSAVSACLPDLQWLYLLLPWQQRAQQLPLLLALAANALAFSSQVGHT